MRSLGNVDQYNSAPRIACPWFHILIVPSHEDDEFSHVENMVYYEKGSASSFYIKLRIHWPMSWLHIHRDTS